MIFQNFDFSKFLLNFQEKIQGKKSTRDVPIGDGIMEEDYEKI